MTKTTKTTKTAENKAAATRAACEKALAEKRGKVKGTCLYGKIKDAVDKAIEKAASEGASAAMLPEVKVPGELFADASIADLVVKCEDPVLVMETLVDDLESEGYKVLRLLGCPVAVAWPEPDAE